MTALRPVPDLIKQGAGHALAVLLPRCRFERSVFLLGHMRSGSTALSNVLCSRPEIGGYGEAHVGYHGRADLGRLAANHLRRHAFRPGARLAFDKILHCRHDAAAPPDFYRAKAIFLARAPEPAIRSIRRLFADAPGTAFATDARAADYYAARVTALVGHWERFPPERRLGLTFEALVADPEAALAGVTSLLDLVPPLENAYRSHAASRTGGGGDPLRSGGTDRIERGARSEAAGVPLALSAEALGRCRDAYSRYRAAIGAGS